MGRLFVDNVAANQEVDVPFAQLRPVDVTVFLTSHLPELSA